MQHLQAMLGGRVHRLGSCHTAATALLLMQGMLAMSVDTRNLQPHCLPRIVAAGVHIRLLMMLSIRPRRLVTGVQLIKTCC